MTCTGTDNYIDDELYRIIKSVLPVFCIDLLVFNPVKRTVILCKRNNEPAKGMWWLPGGRLQKGEETLDAVGRIAKEELGIVAVTYQEIGFYNLQLGDVHTPLLAVLVRSQNENVALDNQHSEYVLANENWIRGLSTDLYIPTVIRDSRVFE